MPFQTSVLTDINDKKWTKVREIQKLQFKDGDARILLYIHEGTGTEFTDTSSNQVEEGSRNNLVLFIPIIYLQIDKIFIN